MRVISHGSGAVPSGTWSPVVRSNNYLAWNWCLIFPYVMLPTPPLSSLGITSQNMLSEYNPCAQAILFGGTHTKMWSICLYASFSPLDNHVCILKTYLIVGTHIPISLKYIFVEWKHYWSDNTGLPLPCQCYFIFYIIFGNTKHTPLLIKLQKEWNVKVISVGQICYKKSWKGATRCGHDY